jgi:uncharacterized protein (DUF608 family)
MSPSSVHSASSHHAPVYHHHRTLGSGIPLGGLGTGSIEIRDDGLFHEWEIFNNYQWSGAQADAAPDMWPEDSFFALRTKTPGGAPKVRLLFDDDKKSRGVGNWYDHSILYNYPFLRYIPEIEYSGQHPFANLTYLDAALPVAVSMRAFTPFIPHNAKDSALPLAFFVFRVRNTSDAPCEASVMFSLRNGTGYDQKTVTLAHEVQRSGSATCVAMTASDMDSAARTFGSMAVAELSGEASVMPAWTDGRGLVGFDNPAAPAWSQLFYPLRDEGALSGADESWSRAIAKRDEGEKSAELHMSRQHGWRWRGAVCRKLDLAPGEEREVVFLMSWFFPNHYHYSGANQRLGHMYENWFSDAADVARYGVANFRRLYDDSCRFADALYDGTLPEWLAASLNAQLTTFPQVFWWTKAGDLAAWEGSACCQIIPNIHTIWSSWQPLMFFPEEYLRMKKHCADFGNTEPAACGEGCGCGDFLELEYRRRAASDQQSKGDLGGWFQNRYKDLGYKPEDFAPRKRGRSTRDGFLHLTSAGELLRDYLWTGDEALLKQLWPYTRTALDAAIAADANGDGLPDGAISWLTYDHWFLPGTNCYRGTMHLGELAAGARLAEIVGEGEFASRLREVVARGSASFEKLYWNGEYYNLAFDPIRKTTDRGCMADQASGQLYLRLCGLGGVHPEDHVRSALRAVRKYNLLEEEGLRNGVDPHGRDDWRYFARYSGRGDDEALAGQWVTPWTGTEYYVAAAMIAEGLVAEGLDVARNVYDRYAAAGMLYNHLECGEHYFRALAVWAMLPALQGLVYDKPGASLEFAPRLTPEAHASTFLLPGAWGRLVQKREGERQTDAVQVVSGELPIRVLTLQLRGVFKPKEVKVTVGGEKAMQTAWRTNGDRLVVELPQAATLGAGGEMTVEVSA